MILTTVNNQEISNISNEEYQTIANTHYWIKLEKIARGQAICYCIICGIAIHSTNLSFAYWYFENHKPYKCKDFLMKQVLE